MGSHETSTSTAFEAYAKDDVNTLYSVGFDLKMGYEKQIAPNMSVDIGPVVNFTNLVVPSKMLRDRYTQTGYRPYRYYIGLDVAVNFGLKK